jgi:hypothetical protein
VSPDPWSSLTPNGSDAGGMVRGMVIEALPGDHVTLRLPTGQIDVIVWARVDRIERAPLASPVPPAPRAPVAPPAAPPPATAIVHVDAEPGVVVKWSSRTGLNGIGQCTAPCDAALPLHAMYFLTGEDIRNSPAFNLEASPGQRVVIHASTASRAGFNGGIAVLSIGGAGVFTGLTMLLLGAYGVGGNCTEGFFFPICSANGGLEVAGAGVALGGVAVALVGVAVFLSNRRTNVTQTVSAFLTSPPRGNETEWRTSSPVWLGSERASVGASRPMAFPVLSRSF